MTNSWDPQSEEMCHFLQLGSYHCFGCHKDVASFEHAKICEVLKVTCTPWSCERCKKQESPAPNYAHLEREGIVTYTEQRFGKQESPAPKCPNYGLKECKLVGCPYHDPASHCVCHCHNEASLHYDSQCRCIKNCRHCHPKNFPNCEVCAKPISDHIQICRPTPTKDVEEWEKEFDALFPTLKDNVIETHPIMGIKVGVKLKDFIRLLADHIRQEVYKNGYDSGYDAGWAHCRVQKAKNTEDEEQ